MVVYKNMDGYYVFFSSPENYISNHIADDILALCKTWIGMDWNRMGCMETNGMEWNRMDCVVLNGMEWNYIMSS